MILYQILSTYSLRKCMETSLENLYVDIGAERGTCIHCMFLLITVL